MKKNPLTTTQIDQLGDRLRAGSYTEADLRLLNEYRRSFGDAYNEVILKIFLKGILATGSPSPSNR